MGRPLQAPASDNILARLRRERGWSQEQAAAALGLSRQQISKLERGIHPIQGAVLILAKSLLTGQEYGET
ncbi:helix-turn-helix transcriptional regulator [Desulfovibrio sp. OttesenSCG-928-A18]|nr:helix-turn-helix transcriptional regulator [Desulfovibrio sp. OttesenSCG-928-A18]